MTWGNARTKAELEEQLLSVASWADLPGKGAINPYQCNTCRIVVVTIHADKGTTPMFMGCKATEGCDGSMSSCGYPPISKMPPDYMADKKVFEWYRPEAGPLGLFHTDQIVDEHIRRGGLLLRPKEDKNG